MALGRKAVNKQESEDKSIEINAQMQGSLSFNDPVNLKINGEFTGSLETKGTLTIGSGGSVNANITGDNIVIAGKVNGDIVANVMLVLMPTAVLTGDIRTPKLNIVEGAIFQGNCQMAGLYEDTGDLLGIDEVAKYLEIDLQEIEALANAGKIPARKHGKTWKFERGTIDEWAASGKVD
ncbi:MAG: polymer-forming cytoskeletal protein [Candidatus Omnitrophica bacterium]|nr:polymer-forming cytoskeletal protein [Candidatus Omnitrophota bacterium]MCB9721768.1 polymer-forming cytoskeletal protein [Candidatus Omnitrophota bacterium]